MSFWQAFTYDAVGNRLTGPAYPKAGTFQQSYSYDYENRIVSATRQVTGSSSADTVTFKYDPFGRRVEKNVSTFENGIPTTYKYTYVYDNEDIILEVLERTQNGNITTTTTAYTHGPGIDEPLSLTRDGQTYYYHADGLGSITSMTDSAQAVANRYAYDSFGALKSSETIRNAYAYTGREYDSETGLYYYRARYYDPEAGRFVSKDPIGFAGGDVNVYGYVANNPINDLDPSGLRSFGSCLEQCTINQFGLQTILGTAGIVSGLPILPTREKVSGATKGTSIASSLLSSLFPQKLPKGIWAPTESNVLARTKVVGRLLGRWIPVAGWGLLAYDAGSIGTCVWECMKNPTQCKNM